MEKTYTSLHNHTDYSNIRMIDAMMNVESLIDRAYELNLKGVAITDHEALSGHVRAIQYFNKKYKEKGDFKLILGNEVYLVRDGLDADNYNKEVDKFFHQLLIAKDTIGHRQLRELSSRAWLRSFRKSIVRVPTYWSDLEEVVGANPGHLIATTTCLAGIAAQLYIMNSREGVYNYIKRMKSIFGEENFFIELQPSYQDDQIKYNDFMIKEYWGKEKFIFTTDSHYLKKEHKELHSAFLNSGRGNRETEKFYSSTYMMDYEEVKEYFKHYISLDKVEEMKENTNRIWDMIESYDLGRPQIVPRIEYDFSRFDIGKIIYVEEMLKKELDAEKYPSLHYFMTTEDDTDSYFINLVYEGYYDKILDSEVPVIERIKRLDYELEQIHQTSLQINQSLSDYFITMAKMIEIVWDQADSLVGVGRGSAVGFLTNYLLGITQLDPMTEAVEIPPWRFIHKSRPELPDIDFDTEATKRTKIFNRIKEYFNSIGSEVINVSTFGTEGTKSSIRTAGRALETDDSIIAYLTSMIPNERGFDWSLSECYNGTKERPRIATFRAEMDENPELRDLAFAIEGLITRIGSHAAGIIILEGEVFDHSSLMRTSSGAIVSAFDLQDTEYLGGLKYDMLTVQALDKIHAAMNYMLEDEVIRWEGSLRETYNKFLLPKVLEKDNIEMWKLLWDGQVTDAFQFDTMVGSQAVKLIKPSNVLELAVANSIMRLMAQEGLELPMDSYIKFKNNLKLWYKEMETYGLKMSDMEVLEPILKPLFGVADSQEAAMQLVMNPKIAGFTLTEANALRKAIARKDPVVLQSTKEMYYAKGQELGTSDYLLDYVWNVQIRRQEGYSFSLLHTMAYSYIALQQLNLVYKFPSIYWKTACLSVNAGAINEEDYYNLVDQGIIELSDEDDVRAQTKIQYGKVATAIANMRGEIHVDLPDINHSRLGFTPFADENKILYGIKGIARVGEKVIQDIILDRPYTSLEDFEKKLNGGAKKKISKDKVVNLIKAGAFDRIENKPRPEILKKYIQMIADQKKKLNLRNFRMLMRKNLVPSSLSKEVANYNFTLYLRQHRSEDRKYYILNEIAQSYFFENFSKDKVITEDDGTMKISSDWWDRVYDHVMDGVREWIRRNQEKLLKELNHELFMEEYNKYAQGTILDWELQALNFFHSGHPLEGVEFPIETNKISDLEEGKIVGFWRFDGKKIPQMYLFALAGTVIERDRQKSSFTLATVDGVVEVKLFKQQFAKYIHESDLEEDDEGYVPNEENFLQKGTHLMVIGVKRGEMFVPKVYKRTPMKEISKIILEDGKFKEFITKGE